MKPIERDLILLPIKNRMQVRFEAFFRGQKAKFMPQFARTKDGWKIEEPAWITESDPPPLTPEQWEQIFDMISLESVGVIGYDLTAFAEEAMLKAGLMKIGSINISPSFTLANPAAKEYLDNYTFDLISKVDATTQKQIGRIVTHGLDEGESYSKVSRNIRDMFDGFSERKPQLHIRNRAELIAVTETGNAYTEAALIQSNALQLAGLPMVKSWNTVGDDRVSDGCRENEAVGWIPLDNAFPSGHMRPLRFPGCRCDLLTRMKMPDEVI